MNSLLRTWATVRPRAWHALAAAELQSLQDVQRLVDSAVGRVTPMPTPTRALLRPEWPGELFRAAAAESQRDELFRNLPGWEQLAKEATAAEEIKATEKKTPAAPHFAAYSFSYLSAVGADGERAASDSSGRLKVVHEREVGGDRHRALWDSASAAGEGEGRHETRVTGGSADEFETLWAQTPFAKVAVVKEQDIKQIMKEAKSEA